MEGLILKVINVYSIIRTIQAYEMTQSCIWDRLTLPYDGLCSHSPLTDLAPGEYGLPPAHLENLEAQAIKKRIESRPRLNDSFNRSWEKAKKADLEGYAVKTRKQGKKQRGLVDFNRTAPSKTNIFGDYSGLRPKLFVQLNITEVSLNTCQRRLIHCNPDLHPIPSAH